MSHYSNRAIAPHLQVPTENSISDVALWDNLMNGNEIAMAMLVRKYADRLFDYGMQQYHDKDRVINGLTNLFSTLRHKRDDKPKHHSVNTLLYKAFRDILTYRTMPSARLYASRQKEPFALASFVESKSRSEPIKVEVFARLESEMRPFSMAHREVIYLKFSGGLTNFEIAEITALKIDEVHCLVSKVVEAVK